MLRTSPLSCTSLAAIALASSASHAQPTVCGVRAQGLVYSVENVPGYNDTRDSGWLTGSASVSPSGVGGGAGCTAQSYINVRSHQGWAAIDGAGSGTNCPTGSSTIYSMAQTGAQARDFFLLTSTTLPVNTPVPVRVRVWFTGACTSVQPAGPFCTTSFRVELSGSLGPFVLQSTLPGVYEGTTSVGFVGNYGLTLSADLRGYAGASTGGMQPVGGPVYTASCSVNTAMRYSIECLDPRVTMTSCSGHNYTPCLADLDDGSGSGTPDGGVDINDLLFFLINFEAGTAAADLDNGGGIGIPDGGVDINDLLFFLVRFEAGC